VGGGGGGGGGKLDSSLGERLTDRGGVFISRWDGVREKGKWCESGGKTPHGGEKINVRKDTSMKQEPVRLYYIFGKLIKGGYHCREKPSWQVGGRRSSPFWGTGRKGIVKTVGPLEEGGQHQKN